MCAFRGHEAGKPQLTLVFFRGNRTEAVKQAGVHHVVYTSMLNPSPNSAFGSSHSNFATEEYLRASGLSYTIVRNTVYLDAVPMLVGEGTLPGGKLYLATGQGQVSYGLRTEMGEALAKVLTSEGHENQVYELAPGPAYSFQDLATILSEVSGQPVAYVPISGEDLAAGMRQHQVPEPFINLLLGLNEAMKNGEFATTNSTFEQLLGRKPTNLRTYLTSLYGQ